MQMAEMWINMGPQHPFTHGLWTLRVKVDGETIVDAEPIIGYLHRGFEKLCENRTYPQIIPICDRLCYVAAMSWDHVYVSAVENMLDLEVPLRAEYIRVIALEIQRIASHLVWLSSFMTDLGNLTAFLYAMREREMFIDLLQALCGARMTYNYPRIGGLSQDMPRDFPQQCLKILDLFERRLKEYEYLIEESEVFRIRTQGVGYLSPSDAINLGVTGPALRGSGVPVDLRKTDPYSAYPDFDFEVCVEKDCDVYARYRVRINEMYESCKIIRQALKKMPPGPVLGKVPHHYPKGEGYARTEDPRGEAFFYVQGDGTDRPYRVKIRSPIFVTVSAVPKMLKGYKVADVPSIMGSLDMCLGESDR
jgi:NADH-quinone oxidoreductase subunit D